MPEDDFLSGLAMFRSGPAPEAGPELRARFASVATIPAVEPARRLPVYKRILTGLPSKITAGALGALLAGSVGAGALTGTMVLTSNDDAPTTGVAACDPAADDVVADDADTAAVEAVSDDSAADESGDAAGCEDPGDDESGDDESAGDEEAAEEPEVDEPKDEVPADLSTVAVPTSVSEAAHNHAFDEACGNHGAYVSHFARTGEEAPCATGATPAADEATATEVGVATAAEPGAEGRAKAAAHREASAERRAAKATSTKSGKGGR